MPYLRIAWVAQRSTETEPRVPSKKRKYRDVAEKLNVKHADDKKTTSKAKGVIMARIDRTNPLELMLQERWKIVKMKLLEALFT